MQGDDPGYFLYHSIGLFPGKGAEMAAALAAFAATWAANDDRQWPAVLAARAEFLALWQALIGVPEGTLTGFESVTAALSSVVAALPQGRLRGKRVLVAADCFPSLHFLLSGLAARHGFVLDTVPLRPGAAWFAEEDMLARLDVDVGLTLLTFVTSTASHRPDLDRLLPAARQAGSLVALDLTQGVGVVPFDAGRLEPDIVVASSLKWLCGAPGAGILHVRSALLPECRPELRGWFSQPDPFSWALDGFAYAPDARRFDAGTPAPLAAIASVPGLRWQAGQGATALLDHAQRLGQRLLDAAPGLGLAPVCPEDPARRGGSVMLHLPETVDPGRLVAALRAEALHADARGQVLRLSPGAVTTEAHVDRMVAALGRLLRAR